MAKRSFLLCFFFIFIFTTSKSQTLEAVKGRVFDYDSKLPISNAGVQAIKGNKSIYNTTSDTSGYFSIPFNIIRTFITLKISHLNYHSSEIQLDSNKTAGLNKIPFLGKFELTANTIHLKEVIIKKNRRYRDTSSIDLSKEIFERSVMIDDLFSQKGLSKDANGKLFYKGNPVSDILVNGDSFFGKSTAGIYDKIPALVLNTIEIIETNIDSLTNTTLLRPTIKLNLKIKEKYQKGIFGSISPGVGTSGRYVINTELYTYAKQQQKSFIGGLNNIGINDALAEPVISFSATGNNIVKKYGKITYRNVFLRKIELNFSAKVKSESKVYESESERTEANSNQFSKTKNSISSSSIEIEDLKFDLKYRIDSLNLLLITNTFNLGEIKNLDSAQYYIQSDAGKIFSDVYKKRKIYSRSLSNSIKYEKKSFIKKGRLFQVEIGSKALLNRTDERINILDQFNQGLGLSNRRIKENDLGLNTYFTEPLGDHGFIKFLASYKNETSDYLSNVTDTSNYVSNNKIRFKTIYLSSGIVLQKTFEKTSISGILQGTRNTRELNTEQNPVVFLNIDLDFRMDRRINKKRTLQGTYSIKTNYPTVNQLTSMDNTFDLISQMDGNAKLKPEIKHNLNLSYDFKKSDSLNYTIASEVSRYYSKHGINTRAIIGKSQINFIDNIGTSTSAQISLSISKIFSSIGLFNYRIGLGYNEMPNIVNGEKSVTSGIVLNQSLSTTRTLAKALSVSPSITISYNEYVYNTGKQTLASLTYTDKIALNLWGFQINNYPIINVDKGNINNNFNWALNTEVKRFIFNKYGVIWIKGYDVFKSFKYRNNTFGPTYTQSIKYSNLNRYFLFGLSLKFNNFR